MTNREYIYRSAYELGRHVIGYEVQKSLALVDWIERTNGAEAKIAIIGYGEGGMLAMYAAAVEPRIDATLISGCFAPREQLWQEPIDRNVFGLLEQFGGAELATMVAPRRLIVQAAQWPTVSLPSEGGAPATLATPTEAAVKQEFDRALQLLSTEAGPSELAKALQFHATPRMVSSFSVKKHFNKLRQHFKQRMQNCLMANQRPQRTQSTPQHGNLAN